MRLLAKSFLLAWLVVAISYLPVVQAQSALPDTDESTRLTDYLHSHRLPLVGAQVLDSRSGGRTVVLYGYTATDFGRNDAETKTRRFLKDADIIINNHIRVEPDLASMKSSAPSAPPAAAAEAPPPDEMGDIQNYQNQQQNDAQQQYMNQQTQQYMNQGNSPAGLAGALIPLLGMGLAIGLGGGGTGFGMGVSPGFGGSPFGSSNPFGSPSPYGGGYGSPYGGSGYGAPYGGAPYGGNPYGGTYP